jgi:phosphatidate phosphatase PAH1
VTRPFHLTVLGDGSRLSGHVWAVAPATPAVLFDIDGTLTTGDGELLEDLLGGGAPDMRPGASDVAKRWVELGYLVVYMTGRPYPLRDSTLRWLDERGFPRGPVLTPEHGSDAIPTMGHVGAFKRATLLALQEDGLVFEAAYGNAATDVCGYAQAGVPPERTWITQPRGPCDGYEAPHRLESYVDHLETLREHPNAPE